MVFLIYLLLLNLFLFDERYFYLVFIVYMYMYYNAVLTISSMMSKKCLKILRGNQNPEIEERQTTQ